VSERERARESERERDRGDERAAGAGRRPSRTQALLERQFIDMDVPCTHFRTRPYWREKWMEGGREE